MKASVGERIREWGRLIGGNSLEAMEEFLDNNSDLHGFLDEVGNATCISKYGPGTGSENHFIIQNQKYIKLRESGIPVSIARFMAKNPDILDISVDSVVNHYNRLIRRYVPDVAAAVFASTDYAGRDSGGIVDKLATDYHVVNSCGAGLELPFYMQRYRKLLGSVPKGETRELAMAFHVIDGLDADYGEE